jgi:organic hydroperoxide reductase OsmC/OhrA
MKPLPHRYAVHLTGGAAGYAAASADGMPSLPMAPPTDFGGPGDAWSPEHLLVASVQACFLFTLRAVARRSQLTILAVDLDATGTLDRQDGVTRFTDIVLHAHVTVPAGTDLDRARQALEKSKKACLISASLLTPVRVEPVVVELCAGEAAA